MKKKLTLFFFIVLFLCNLWIYSHAQQKPIIEHKAFLIQLKQKYPKNFRNVNFPDTFYFKNQKTGTDDYFTINQCFTIEPMKLNQQPDLNHDGKKEIIYIHRFEEYKGAISIFQIKQEEYFMLDFFPLPPADRYLIFHETGFIQLTKNCSILKVLISNDYPTINPETGLRGLTSERILYLFDFKEDKFVNIFSYSGFELQ